MSAAFLVTALARVLAGARTVAIGANSPIPAAAALLAQRLDPGLIVSILGSRRHNPFTNGSVELFDFAAEGRLDRFVLGGVQIDGHANINLVATGDYARPSMRFPGSFGSAFLYGLAPVVLFREEHSPRTLVPKVDFISAAGTSPPGHYRRGGPTHLLTGKALFAFDGRFRLESVHPGYTVADIVAATGFAFDRGEVVETPAPSAEEEALLPAVLADLAEDYPEFVRRVGR